MPLGFNAYERHYELIASLAKEPRLIQSPDLYPFDDGEIYAAMMDLLAQPLDNGTESPYSSKIPGSGQALLMGAVIYQLRLFANQLNLMPDKAWIDVFRMLGTEIEPEELPIINLVFRRSDEAIRTNQTATVPIGTNAFYRFDETIVATVTEELTISGNAAFGVVPARLSQRFASPDFPVGSFVTLDRRLPFIDAVNNNGEVANPGNAPEDLSAAMLRARELYRTGDRCVTPRDYERVVLSTGLISKVNVIPGYQIGASGYFPDLTTIAIFPGSPVQSIENKLSSLTGARISVIPATIVPVDGDITVRIVPTLSDDEAFNLVAKAIVDNVNPPNGTWGDLDLVSSLGTALENSTGIYAVPSISLKHSETNVPYLDLVKDSDRTWLYEIQASLEIKYLR